MAYLVIYSEKRVSFLRSQLVFFTEYWISAFLLAENTRSKKDLRVFRSKIKQNWKKLTRFPEYST